MNPLGDPMSRTNPGTRSDYAAFRGLQTRWNDNDIYGHMNNVVHYQLFDTAVNSWMIEHGILDPRAGETVFLVVETGCRYFGEMAFPDVITAGLRLAHLGNSSLKYEVGLFCNDNDIVSAEGHFVHVHVNRISHRPQPMSFAQRSVFQELLL